MERDVVLDDQPGPDLPNTLTCGERKWAYATSAQVELEDNHAGRYPRKPAPDAGRRSRPPRKAWGAVPRTDVSSLPPGSIAQRPNLEIKRRATSPITFTQLNGADGFRGMAPLSLAAGH